MLENLFERQIGIQLEDNIRLHFFIVGAGGTGGHLIPNLSRLISLVNKDKEEKEKYTLTIIDADLVEEKNLIRQNFTMRDIGKNKAEVMANRYGRAFSMDIGFYPKYINSPIELFELVNNVLLAKSDIRLLTERYKEKEIKERADYNNLFSSYLGRDMPVFIDCTDNNKTRLIINDVHKALGQVVGNNIFISSGNEERSGQVIFGLESTRDNNLQAFNRKLKRSGVTSLSYISNTIKRPSFFDVFPNARMDKLPDEMSCAEAAVSAPQNIGANINAANIIFDFVNKLINRVPIYELAIFFSIDTMNRSVFYHTETDLERLLSIVENNASLYQFMPEKEVPNVTLIRYPDWINKSEDSIIEVEVELNVSELETPLAEDKSVNETDSSRTMTVDELADSLLSQLRSSDGEQTQEERFEHIEF